MVPLRLRPSEPPTPSTPHTTTSFQQFIHGINILNSSGRTQQQSSKRRSSEACQRFPSLFPVLPNPFDHIHPALRLPTSTPSTIHPAVASPASTRTRFSAMASNPFLARSSFFTRRAEAPTVLDYGGNVPIETAGSRQGTDIGIFASGDESRREWPAPSGRRRRRTKTRRRKSQKTSAPILFPAMQSRRVRAKMLQSLILGSILVMLLITCEFELWIWTEFRC